MKIMVLGLDEQTATIAALVTKVVDKLDIEVEIIEVKEPMRILSLGVIRTPAVIIDDTVVHSGSMPKLDELENIIARSISDQ